jgi:hypothetical protein
MTNKRLKALTTGIVLAAFSLAIPLQASAQDEDRTWLQVRTTHVKPDRVQEFVALQEKFAKALAADERPDRDVWEEVRGDNSTFHSVTAIDNLAELDEPFDPPMGDKEWQEWVAALLSTIDSSTRTILRSHLDWTIPADDDNEPGLLRLRSIQVKPGSMYNYHGWVVDQLIPALKANGAKGVSFNHSAFGGDTSTWVMGSRLDNFAELQKRKGSLSGMSDEDYAALMGASADMVLSTDIRILRYRADLSN